MRPAGASGDAPHWHLPLDLEAQHDHAASIDVTVERGVLRISGERDGAGRGKDAKVQAYAAERPVGRFSRAVSLPDDADTSKVEAKYRDGVLQVSIGLSESAQPQRSKVQ